MMYAPEQQLLLGTLGIVLFEVGWRVAAGVVAGVLVWWLGR